MYVYMLFGSTGRAMRAENILHRAGVTGKLVPVPRYIASDCGVCLRVAAADVEAARRALSAARLEPVSVHDEWRPGCGGVSGPGDAESRGGAEGG